MKLAALLLLFAAADPPPSGQTLSDATIRCFEPSCSTDDPATPFDMAECQEHHMNTTLIAAATGGDRKAIELLQQRYPWTFTYSERHRIAGALLGRATDDREYWNELSERANEALRFAYVDGKPSSEYVRWCNERRVDPDRYRWMTISALVTASADRRGNDLLRGALESSDKLLITKALLLVAAVRDESFLPDIERALTRSLPRDAIELASYLSVFRSDAADRVAMKFLPAEKRESYLMERRVMDEQQP